MPAPELTPLQAQALGEVVWDAHGEAAFQLVSDAAAHVRAVHPEWTAAQAFQAGLLSLQPKHHTFSGAVAPDPLLRKGIRDDRA